MPGYVEWLRARVGHRKIILPYATALVRDDQGRLLFQRRTDFAWWGLPGGVLELGETFEQCAVRETLEETGLRVQALGLRGVYTSPDYDVHYPNGDEAQQFTAAVECRCLSNDAGRADGLETLEHRFFTAEEAVGLPLPLWYKRMAGHFFTPGAPRFFDPPAGRPAGQEWWLDVRRQIGLERLIVIGAGAYIENAQGRVLLSLRREGLWGIPAGLMELGETISATLLREAREEMAADLAVSELLGVFTGPRGFHTYPDGNQVQIVSTLFRASLAGGDLRPDGEEIRELGWFDPRRLPEMVERHRQMVVYAAGLP